MNARQQLVQLATEAGDLEYAAFVAADRKMTRAELLPRIRYYQSH